MCIPPTSTTASPQRSEDLEVIQRPCPCRCHGFHLPLTEPSPRCFRCVATQIWGNPVADRQSYCRHCNQVAYSGDTECSCGKKGSFVELPDSPVARELWIGIYRAAEPTCKERLAVQLVEAFKAYKDCYTKTVVRAGGPKKKSTKLNWPFACRLTNCGLPTAEVQIGMTAHALISRAQCNGVQIASRNKIEMLARDVVQHSSSNVIVATDLAKIYGNLIATAQIDKLNANAKVFTFPVHKTLHRS